MMSILINYEIQTKTVYETGTGCCIATKDPKSYVSVTSKSYVPLLYKLYTLLSSHVKTIGTFANSRPTNLLVFNLQN